ncbi:MAG: hypothetical protein WCC17_04980 [Candidatus Nitrosopolaris sp.]
MSPAKIKEHEPTAVKREMTENITGDETTSTTDEAREKTRRSGMTKGLQAPKNKSKSSTKQ